MIGPLRDALARTAVVAAAGLAVFVQLAVWGATNLRADGALLESWQRYFGWPYAVALALAEMLLVAQLRLVRAMRWLVLAWVSTIPFGLLGWATSRRPDLDPWLALASGLGAVALAAGVLDGRFGSRGAEI